MTVKKASLVLAWIVVAWIMASNLLVVLVDKEHLSMPAKVLGVLCLIFILWRAVMSNK